MPSAFSRITMSEKKIQDYIRANLPEYRLKHTLGVWQLSVEMARHYKVDEKKAAEAALLHDVVRHYSNQELLKLAAEQGVTLDSTLERAPYLLHAPLGAHAAQRLFGVDAEVASAIQKHTLGDEAMTPLDKILYLADWAEAGRQGETVEKVRELIYKDLDQAMYLALNETLTYLVRQNLLIHPQTVKARNAFLAG